jgi:TonB family protein
MARRPMLKPDPTRYPGVVHTRSSGPEWIDTDSAENIAESGDTFAFQGQEELPADLALDLRLHEILDQALLTTAATGAVIALASGDKMVCRATAGDKAPSAGVCLNTRSGLSGACVQSREMQLCDDALTDIRVNAAVCRDLGIRSILALPVLDGEKLWGILEVFSAVPSAFSDSDLQALQALSDRISHTVHEAVEGETWVPASDTFSEVPLADSAQPEPVSHEALLATGQQDTGAGRRDYRTGALTAAVIALAVLLGWMVGRVGWSMAVSRSQTQFPVNPEPTQAAVQAPPDTPPALPHAQEPTGSAKPVRSTLAAHPATKSVPKPKVETAEPVGGLVVYEHGKVVFRMAPSEEITPVEVEPGSGSTPGSIPGAIQSAATREDDSGVAPAIPPPAANGSLVERVEPQYPEKARQQHIQGPVVLNALVGKEGSVRELKVVSGNPELVKAAADAVRQWRFRPHHVKGRPVEFETRITVNFQLP